MPREVIHHDTPNSQPFKAIVGWNRECDVQIGLSTSDDDGSLIRVMYADEREKIAANLVENLEAAGWVLMPAGPTVKAQLQATTLGAIVIDSVADSAPCGSSIWWHPSRHQINTLIRHLRRARDAAFGRDE